LTGFAMFVDRISSQKKRWVQLVRSRACSWLLLVERWRSTEKDLSGVVE